MYQIHLIPRDQPHSIIPLLRLLNDAIDENTPQDRLEDMKQRNDECAGVYDNGRLVASGLNCYVVNDKGIRCWLNQGYRTIGFHCQKKLQ